MAAFLKSAIPYLKLFFIFLIFSCSSGGSLRLKDKSQDKESSTVEAKLPTASNNIPTIYRNKVDAADAQEDFLAAKRIYLQGNKIEAAQKIHLYAQQNPNGQYVDEAYLILAELSFDKDQLVEAQSYVQKILSFNPPSRFRSRALILNAKISHANGQNEEALSNLSQIQLEELPQSEHLILFTLWGNYAEEQGNFRDAVLAYVKASRQPNADSSVVNELHSKASQIIATKLDQAQVQFILQEYGSKYFPGNAASLRMAKLYMAKGQKSSAESYLNNILAYENPDSSYYREAQFLKQNFASYNDVADYKIGLLFPTGGKYVAWTQRAREGLDLAWQKGSELPEVVLEDAGEGLEAFQHAFEKLVLKDKVLLIVGPASADQAELAAQLSQQYGVPYISLSPRSGLIEKSPFVFRFALSAELQAQAIVNYAWDKLGAKRFAVLFPEDNFGSSFAKPYVEAVKNRGGRITAMESYNPNESDFVDVVRNMVGTGISAFRSAELQEEIKIQEERTGKKLTPREKSKIKLSPIVDFDVLFIPDTFKAVGQIIPTLLFEDIKDVKLFGPSSWNNKKLLQRAGQYMENSYCVDVNLNEKTDKASQQFTSQYKLKYGRLPSELSAITYDLGLSLLKIFKESKNLHSREELRGELESLGEIEGAVGKHKWDAERDPLGTLQLFQSHRSSFQYIGDVSVLDYDSTRQ